MPAPIRLSALVRSFLLAMEVENLSPATLGWYGWRLDRLVRWAGDPPARSLGPDDLRRWLLAMRAGEKVRPTADSYVEGHRRAASAFLNWAVREGHLTESPLARIRRIRVDQRELPTLSAADVACLMDALSPRTFAGRRNRLMTALLYDTGIQIGELISLRPADLDLDGRTLRVHGKGRRDRRVPLSPAVASLLASYVAERPAGERLFTSAAGAALRATAVNQWLRRAARAAGISGKRVSPHTFRHSFATAYLANGGDEFTLQRILGHATLDMVRRYVHLAESDVARRHAQASPFSRIAEQE